MSPKTQMKIMRRFNRNLKITLKIIEKYNKQMVPEDQSQEIRSPFVEVPELYRCKTIIKEISEIMSLN